MAARRASVRGLWVAGCVLFAFASAVPTARGHVVVSRATLRQSLQHSALCIRARIDGEVRVLELADGDRQEVQRLRVESVLGGPRKAGVAVPGVQPGDAFDVFYHAEGLPDHRPGMHALIFLEPTADRPELSSLAEALPWFSVQGPGDEWVLEGDAGQRIEAQARAWLDWTRNPAADRAGLRGLLLSGLDSGVDRLEADAVIGLVQLGRHRGIVDDPAMIDALATRAADPSRSLARRVTLLRLIEPHLGARSAVLWSSLVDGVSTDEDALVLAGLAGARPDPAIARWLRQRTDDPSPAVRRAIWRALARSSTAADLELLARGSRDPDPVVARSAIQGIGVLGGEEARARLVEIAAGGSPERARWAAAALRRSDAAAVRP